MNVRINRTRNTKKRRLYTPCRGVYSNNPNNVFTEVPSKARLIQHPADRSKHA